MTRQELKTALVQAYLWNPPYKKDHPLWKEALELYKKETGDNSVALGCGTCMNKIKNYLSK